MTTERALQTPGRQGLSSWYTQGSSDGLGDRLLMSDDGGAPSWEVLRLRPELIAGPDFKEDVRRQLERVAAFRHPSFPSVRAVDDLGTGNGLLLVSSHTPGRRLARALDRPRSAAFAMNLIRELTPPLASLQQHADGMAHGALTANRIIVTTEGRLNIREYVLGPALSRLELPVSHLWSELGIVLAASETGDPVPLDQRADVVQVGIIALSSVIGRCIGPKDYPDQIAELLERSVMFPPLKEWLQRALQLSSGAFASAADAKLAVTQIFTDKLPGETEIRASLAAFAQDAQAKDSRADAPEPRLKRILGNVRARHPRRPTVVPRLLEDRSARLPSDALPRPIVQAPPLAAVSEPVLAPVVSTTSTPPGAVPTVEPISPAVPDALAGDIEVIVPDVVPAAAVDLTEDLSAADADVQVADVPIVTPEVIEVRRPAPKHVPRIGAIKLDADGSEPEVAMPTRSGNNPHRLLWDHSVLGATAGEAVVSARSSVFSRVRGLSPLTAAVAVLAVGQVVLIGRMFYSSPTMPDVASPVPAQAALAVPAAPAETRSVSDETPKPPDRDNQTGAAAELTQQAVPKPDAGAIGDEPTSASAMQPRSGAIRLKSPVEIHVLEGDRLLGSTEDGPIVLPVGRHVLELVNSAVGYHGRRTVEIKPGEVLSMSITPSDGSLNINARPWAEVSVDGKSVGETPIANVILPPGEHEVVFRHPSLGERRQKAVVRSDAVTRVSANLEP